MADGVIRRFVTAIFDRESALKVERQLADSLADAGKKGGENFLREIRAAFTKETATLKVALAKGIISPAEFRKQSDLAAQQFNIGLLKGMEEARRAGTLTEREFVKLSRQLKRIGDDGEQHVGGRLVKSFKTAAIAAVAFFSLDRIRAFGSEVIRTTTEIQRSVLRLRGVWEANAGAVGRSFAQVEAFTRDLRNTTLFSREEIELATAQLLSFKAVSGDTFERTLRLATNLSSVFGGLSQSTQALAKALDDPIRGLGDLRKQGFTFTGEVEKQIKVLVEQGQLFEAQRVILSQLETETGNVAQLMATRWTGAVNQFGKAWEDIKESIGNALIAAGGGTSVLNTLTGTMRGLADNMVDILALVGNLTKALVVGGLVVGFVRLRTAILAANVATITFMGTLRAGLALLGPAGLFAIGVSALTVIFQRAGSAARQAAADAKAAMETFREAIAGQSAQQLDLIEAGLDARAERLAKKIRELNSQAREVRFGASGLPLAGDVESEQKRIDDLTAAERELAAVRAKGAAISAERTVAANAEKEVERAKERERQAAADALRADAEREAKRQREQFEERSAALQQEIADLGRLKAAQAANDGSVPRVTGELERERELREAVKGLTADQAVAVRDLVLARNAERDAVDALVDARRQELELEQIFDDLEAQDKAERGRQADVLADIAAETAAIRQRQAAEREGSRAVQALNRDLFVQQELFRSGAAPGSAFAAQITAMAGAQFDAAHDFASPWIDAMALIENEVLGAGTLFADLGRAWAEGGFAGIAALAKAKVKENIAAAIEAAARALGALGLGNPAAARNFAASAAQHTAAAAAWSVAGTASGGSGGGGAAAGGGGITNPQAGSAIPAPRPEVTVILEGAGFDALNPIVQDVVMGAMKTGAERVGANATVKVIRRR